MLSIVFDLVYSTFWTTRSERELHREHFLRVQVLIKRLAGVLFRAPAPDGSTPRMVGQCVEEFAAEVERLGVRGDLGGEQLAEARLRLEQMRSLAEKMLLHCAELEGEGVRTP